MSMEISPSWVSAGVAVLGLIVGWLRSVDAAQENRIKEMKETHRTLFSKFDQVNGELREYKTHVAETYVNRVALNEALAPLRISLDKIEDRVMELSK